MNLKTTPFTDYENKKKYQMSSFQELGIDINILNEAEGWLIEGNCLQFKLIIEVNLS